MLLVLLKPLDQPVYVAKYPKISDLRSIEGKRWSSEPPYMATCWLNPEHLSSVVAMKPEPATHIVTLLYKAENI